MIKNSVCVFPQETVIPLPVSKFFNEVLYLCCQIVELPKVCRKIFLHNRSNLMTDYIWEIGGKKCPKSTFLSVSY